MDGARIPTMSRRAVIAVALVTSFVSMVNALLALWDRGFLTSSASAALATVALVAVVLIPVGRRPRRTDSTS